MVGGYDVALWQDQNFHVEHLVEHLFDEMRVNLCIHQFRDGNGRVSCLLPRRHRGRAIRQSGTPARGEKERYYEVLVQSSRRWHQGKHDPWPTINVLLYILKQARKEFEERVGRLKSPRRAKTDMVERAIETMSGEFGLTDVEWRCPGVSCDMICLVLRELKAVWRIECLGRRSGTKWRTTVRSLKQGSREGGN